MQLAKLTLKSATLAVLTLCASAASAISPPPEPLQGPVGAVPGASSAHGKVLTSNAVQAVSMGKPMTSAEARRKAIGTIAELEELQRQTALAEARKRLQELQGGAMSAMEVKPEQAGARIQPGGVLSMNPGGASSDAHLSRLMKARNKKRLAAMRSASSTPVRNMEFDPAVSQQPNAKLVNLLVVGGRARADVLEDGRVLTLKEGDKVGQWTVASITSEGVSVEYRYTVDVPAHPVVPPTSKGVRPAIADAFPAAYALANSHGAIEQQERVKTVKLASATPQEIAAVVGVAPVMGGALPPTIPAATNAPVPAGGNGTADSTSVAPVPPLPAALASAR